MVGGSVGDAVSDTVGDTVGGSSVPATVGTKSASSGCGGINS